MAGRDLPVGAGEDLVVGDDFGDDGARAAIRNFEAALAQIGEGRQGKVLLISDGNENRGETARVVPVVAAVLAKYLAAKISSASCSTQPGRGKCCSNSL